MKKLILFALMVVSLNVRSEQPVLRNIPLTWDYSGPIEGVTSYLREVNPNGTTVLAVTSSTSYTLANVVPGVYKWTVTASNAFWGETAPSIPYITPAPAVIPTNLKPLSTSYRVTPPVTFERQNDIAIERIRLFRPDSNGVMVVLHTVSDSTTTSPFNVRPDPKPIK